jgi:hypothetical protein
MDQSESRLLNIPTEDRVEILRAKYIPQTVRIQECTVAGRIKQAGQTFAPLVDTDPTTVYEIIQPYVTPITLKICSKIRGETQDDYMLILKNAIPKDGVYYNHSSDTKYPSSKPDPYIYFNFKIDTLAYHPNVVTRTTYIQLDGDERVNEELVDEPKSAAQCFGRLKELLHKPENNLEKVKSILLGNFSWLETLGSESDTDQDQEGEDENALEFKQNIANGFQNLKELILAYNSELPTIDSISNDDADSADSEEGRLYVNFASYAGRQQVTKEITAMFKSEQKKCVREKRPPCKIPTITLISEKDQEDSETGLKIVRSSAGRQGWAWNHEISHCAH